MHKVVQEMHKVPQEMQSCIDECLRCYQYCTSTAMIDCLEPGGKHVTPQLFRMMAACAGICQTSAHFMLLGSSYYKLTCRLCAQICLECATECERLGNMQECVDACRRCAKSCRKMAA